MAGGGAPTAPNYNFLHLLVDFVFCKLKRCFLWHLYVGRTTSKHMCIDPNQRICVWMGEKLGVLSTLSAQDSGLFISSAQWPFPCRVLTETTGWPNWPKNSLGLRNKQDWLVKEGIMKHTYNEKRVTAMSQLEKEKQESKESKTTVACSTERS